MAPPRVCSDRRPCRSAFGTFRFGSNRAIAPYDRIAQPMPIAISQLSTATASRYAIEREIGRGGMATVFRVRDLRHDRTVALKVLDPELSAILGVERFLSEIRVTARLQHPTSCRSSILVRRLDCRFTFRPTANTSRCCARWVRAISSSSCTTGNTNLGSGRGQVVRLTERPNNRSSDRLRPERCSAVCLTIGYR